MYVWFFEQINDTVEFLLSIIYMHDVVRALNTLVIFLVGFVNGKSFFFRY